MPASNSLKAADKQKITKKLVTELKKHYKSSLPKQSRSIFETLLFSACLEDSTYEQAEAAYARMLKSFFDLNEIRVSSVREIEAALGNINDANWKALRIREVLQYIFETYYAFDLEQLKRKTQDAANKELMTIPHLSSFMRDYTIQGGLGGHVLPVDETMANVLKWMCLAKVGDTSEQTADAIKAGLKKSEGPLFCHLLKCAATDSKLQPAFEQFAEVTDENPLHAAKRLVGLIKNPVKKKAPKKAAAKVSKKKPAKKTSSRKKAAAKKKKTTTTTKKKTVKKKAPVKKKVPVKKKAAKRKTTKKKKK